MVIVMEAMMPRLDQSMLQAANLLGKMISGHL
jgi:hypothetical protein